MLLQYRDLSGEHSSNMARSEASNVVDVHLRSETQKLLENTHMAALQIMKVLGIISLSLSTKNYVKQSSKVCKTLVSLTKSTV